ncbi:MAG: Dabb family protein [Sedimentisphaerales bacterium]|nr:Dabb family protein [Sedimentisphaerales bacterium]
MRRLVALCMLSASVLWAGCSQTGQNTCVRGECPNCICSKPVLRHVVLFKFKDGTTPEQVNKIEQAFAALPNKIKGIVRFEWGTDVSPEGKAQGFTHCFLLTFRSEADRDAYLPHPAHKEFGSIVGPHLDKVCVVDYWTKR